MEDRQNMNEDQMQEFIEVTEDSKLLDMSEAAPDQAALNGAGSTDAAFVSAQEYARTRKKNAAAYQRQSVILMVLAGLLGVARLAAILSGIWFFSTQIGFTVSQPDDGDRTASNGIISFSGNIISSDLQKKLAAIQARIDQYFLFDTEETDYETGILKGYLNALGDPYTVYYTPEEFNELMESTSGRYSGIGVVVQQNTNGMITVVRPYLDGPGYAAGIRTDDIIYKVNGEEVSGQDLSLVVSRIKGEAGTTVDLQIYRPSTNEYIDMTVERAELEIETIQHDMPADGIGRISMSSFDTVTYDQFMDAFHLLKEDGMQALIIDLRDNGGGLLDSATDMLDELLPEGVLTYTEDRDGKREYYRSGASAILDIPTVVLVNGYSASASEIFTGAMRDYGAATIVGEKTFGKGIVQVILTLGDGSAMKITTSRYYLPSGVCIHEQGIEPDVEVQNDPETEEDEQLQKAIEVLQEQLTE